MPRMDGFELLATLRDDTRWGDIPVVMITSRMADRHRQRAMQLGANAYMGKPYSEDALLALLSEMLANGRSNKIASHIVTSNTINIETNTAINAATKTSTNTATEIDSMSNVSTVIVSN
jgi:DNA-binding response OmpR family regulator